MYIHEIIGNAVEKGKLVNIKISLLRKDVCYSQRELPIFSAAVVYILIERKSCTLCAQIRLHCGMKK